MTAIRFASVYRKFEGAGDFEAELRRLAERPDPSDPKDIIGGSRATLAAGEPQASATTRREHVE